MQVNVKILEIKTYVLGTVRTRIISNVHPTMLYDDIAFDKIVEEDDFVFYPPDIDTEMEICQDTDAARYIIAFINVEIAKLNCSAAVVAKIVSVEVCNMKQLAFANISKAVEVVMKYAEQIADDDDDSISNYDTEFNANLNADLASALTAAAMAAKTEHTDAVLAKTIAETIAEQEMLNLKSAEELLAQITKTRG